MDQRDIQQLIDAGLVTTSIQEGDIILIARPNPLRGDNYTVLTVDKKDFFSTKSLGYKSYVAMLSQSGTNAPTAIVLENNLGVSVNWSYSGPGQYILNADSDLFTDNKVYVMAAHTTVSGLIIVEVLNSIEVFVGTINASTLLYQNGLLSNSCIEIRIYS